MAMWVSAMLGWLLGVALPLGMPALPSGTGQLAAVVLGLLVMAAVVRARSWAAWYRCLGVLCAVALLAWAQACWRAQALVEQQVPPAWEASTVRLEGQIDGLPVRRGDAWQLEVLVRRLDGEVPRPQWPARVMLYWRQAEKGLPDVESGQVWSWPVRFRSPQGPGNPAGFDQALWLLEHGMRATATVRAKGEELAQLIQPARGWTGSLDRFRQRVRERIAGVVIDTRLAGVLAGLTVGDQSAIDAEDWDVFRQTGVAHLISISGLHIAMVGWMVAGAVSAVWRRSPKLIWRRPTAEVAAWSMVLGAAGYAVLAGWGVPAQRTVCMLLVSSLLRLSGRRWPWPLQWLIGATVVTAWDPWALAQAGFWLSFVAVGVLLASGPSVQRGDEPVAWPQRWGRAAREAVRTQWLATLGLLPLGALIFQQVSVVGFLANLVAIPVFTLLVTPLALAGMVWSPLWHVAAWVLHGCLGILQGMAAWPGAVWYTAAWPAWLGPLAIGSACLLVMPVPRGWRWLGLPLLLPVLHLPFAWGTLSQPSVGQFGVLAPDVGQGTAVVIYTARHALLFDTGPKLGERSDAGQRVVVPVLRSVGLTRLDEVVLSHGDADHTGGALSVDAAIPVSVWRTTLAEDDPVRVQLAALQPLRAHVPCQAGQQWQWDGVLFEVLHPTADELAGRSHVPDNALSCVIRVVAQARHGHAPKAVLLTGDVEAPQEAALLHREGEAGRLTSTLLVAPHHGSKTSSTEGFLKAVAPRQVLVQAGLHNRYGHPAPSVVARYDALGLQVLQSSTCGAYLWFSDGSPGRCWRVGARRYWHPASRTD